MNWDKKRSEDMQRSLTPSGLRRKMAEQGRQQEATVTAGFQGIISKPFIKGKEKGTEEYPRQQEAISAGRTSNDAGHSHEALVDDSGNGRTSTDGADPHSHDIRSFRVSPYQDDSGMMSHDHPGQLNRSNDPTHCPTPKDSAGVL